MTVRFSAALCGAAVLLATFGARGASAADAPSPWVTAWATALQAVPQMSNPPALYRTPDVTGRTVRQILYPTLSGDVVRLRISNAFARTPLSIDEVRIARGSGTAGQTGAGVAVTFGGKPALTVAPGATVDSDPVRIVISAGAPYVVSSFVGRDQRITAWHRVENQFTYISTPGNHAADTTSDAYRQKFTQFVWVTGVQVNAPAASTIAAIGDSITDGMRSSINQNRRWPDAFARKVAQGGARAVGVINLGISGNRLLSDSSCYGEALASRFERDVVAQPGVRTAVLLIGINDINFADMPPRPGLDCDAPHTAVTAQSLIDGYKRVIGVAHAHGLRIVGGTLTPAALPPRREAIRTAVNEWIRTSRAFDGVVDFDAALRDPVHPTRLRASYDSGDGIHPSDAGYAAMADAVPLPVAAGAPSAAK